MTVDVHCQAWKIGKVCFEADTEPYSVQRDQGLIQNIEAAGVPWHSFVSHTLYVRSDGNTSSLFSHIATLQHVMHFLCFTPFAQMCMLLHASQACACQLHVVDAIEQRMSGPLTVLLTYSTSIL